MPVFIMYSTVLTELGIVVFDNQKCVKTFPFENPAEDYVLVKKGQAKLAEIGKFLANNELVIVNDHGLLDILKKKSMDVQLMSNEQTDTIQSSKLKILVDSGLLKMKMRQWKNFVNLLCNFHPQRLLRCHKVPTYISRRQLIR